ncbi:hypothetical protein ACIKTA_09160, partial [Hansschlegelia beijingensis]
MAPRTAEMARSRRAAGSSPPDALRMEPSIEPNGSGAFCSAGAAPYSDSVNVLMNKKAKYT